MKRGWKILIAIVIALVALLAINMVIVDGQTKDAEVTVDGGEIISLPGGDVQVTDTGEPTAGDAGAPIVLIHCFGCSLNWWAASTASRASASLDSSLAWTLNSGSPASTRSPTL